MTTLALTGATGTIGGLAARHLAEAGHEARLLVRDPSRAPDLGFSLWECAYDQGAALREALAGVDVLLLVSAHESDHRVEDHRTVVEAAADSGVKHVVYTSFVGAGGDSTFTLGRDHGATEEIIRDAGLDFTFLRDNFYSEIFPHFADENGVIRGPAGQGRVAAVSQRDVAEVAAAVLVDPGSHLGAVHDLTGPQAFTLAEAAQTLSQVLGSTVTFHDETEEEAHASRAHFGAPDWQVEAWVSTYTAIRDGELEGVSGAVEAVLGRPARSLEDALRAART
ncbi:NAD(P)-dependent oxidoreductase [Aeromicrobium sp. Root495]|uniref:SDR family oxidoreductase n=1 Tax=Aeromicrobium sp. Root495 TaxID=1736550 RepID=UPI0006F683CE|nr:SDR family oxidoreductase [Aeromicrobium sp. Root495]KQY55963.1 NAD(P)-dependent oxidoreductase [Aeromicrobium sp. Root495]